MLGVRCDIFGDAMFDEKEIGIDGRRGYYVPKGNVRKLDGVDYVYVNRSALKPVGGFYLVEIQHLSGMIRLRVPENQVVLAA